MARPVQPFVAALIVGVIALAPGTTAGQQPAGSAVIAGQVIDATGGRPIGGAVVTLLSETFLAAAAAAQATALSPPAAQAQALAQARRGVAVANAEGRFVFRDLAPGSYVITSTLEGYAGGSTGRQRPGGPGRSFPVDAGGRVTNLVIPMWRLAAISGMVRDDRGEPVIGVAVWAMRRTTTGGRLELTFAGGTTEATDDRGHYRLSNLMPGAYVVGVRSSTQSAAVSTVDAYQAAVTSGSTAAIQRTWGETGALRVSNSGLLVDDWQVSISVGMLPPLPGPKGTLLVHPTLFHAGSTSAAEATVITLGAGDDRTGVDLSLPLVAGVRVSGVLTGPDGPAAGHGVRLVPVSADGPAFDIPAAYSMTDAAGRFALFGVTPGAYTVRAYRVQQAVPGMRIAPPPAGGIPVTTVDVTPPRAGPPAPSLFAELPVTVGTTHVDGLALTLQPGARLSGRVAFEGATLPPAAARLQSMAVTIRALIGTVPGADARVDAEGRFTTSGYPPGRYTVLNITSPGPEWSLASIRIGDVDAAGQAFTLGGADINDVVFTFTDRPISLSGTVRAADSGSQPEGTIVLFPSDFDGWLKSGMSPRRMATTAISATGTYQMRVPLPGDYLVVAVPPDVAPEVDREFVTRFASGAARVSFASGETKTQALTVSRSR